MERVIPEVLTIVHVFLVAALVIPLNAMMKQESAFLANITRLVRLLVYERVGVLLIEVFERVGKILVSKKAQYGKQIHFMAKKKSRKRPGFVIFPFFKTVYLQQLKGMQSSKLQSQPELLGHYCPFTLPMLVCKIW